MGHTAPGPRLRAKLQRNQQMSPEVLRSRELLGKLHLAASPVGPLASSRFL
jgi:hypothetical protein